MGAGCHKTVASGKGKTKITRAVKIPGPDPEPAGSTIVKNGKGRGRRRRLILRVFGWVFAGVCAVLAGAIYFEWAVNSMRQNGCDCGLKPG